MGLSKAGRLTLTLSRFDAEIEQHKRAIIELQRQRVLASIEAQREIKEEGERRSKAKATEVAA
jgi:hypothetical protein